MNMFARENLAFSLLASSLNFKLLCLKRVSVKRQNEIKKIKIETISLHIMESKKKNVALKKEFL